MTEAVERYLATVEDRLAEQLGDPEHGRDALLRVAGRLRRGEDLPAEVREWLADALSAIVSGENPRQAFGLPTSPGRPSDSLSEFEKVVGELLRTLKRFRAFAREFVVVEIDRQRPERSIKAAVEEAAANLEGADTVLERPKGERSVREAVRSVMPEFYRLREIADECGCKPFEVAEALQAKIGEWLEK